MSWQRCLSLNKNENLKPILFILISVFQVSSILAQEVVSDTTGKAYTFNIIHKDDRIDLLGKKMLEYNEALALKIQLVDGYRLQLLNTTDRELALKIRSFLIKTYPDQKLYMTFQSPYLKLKIGNFIIREDAEKFRDILIESKVIPNNIYVVPEKVEQKPVEKNANTPADEQ